MATKESTEPNRTVLVFIKLARKKNIAEKIRAYDNADLECARIILAEPTRYGGDGSLMVSWAQAIERKLCPTTEPEIDEQLQTKPDL